MIYRQFYLNRKNKIVAYILLITVAMTAIIFPKFAFDFLGYTIAGVSVLLIGLLGYSLMKQYRTLTSIPPFAYYQLLLLSVLAFIFIIIPATSLQEFVGFLLFLILLLIGFYHLYLRQRIRYLLPQTKNYLYGLASLIGAIIVLLNRDQSSERLMQLIGCLLLYVAYKELWKLRR